MALFIKIGKSLYFIIILILIGTFPHHLLIPVIASPQFGTDFTLPAPLGVVGGGDSTIQQDATTSPPPINPTTPDAADAALPPLLLADGDTQWTSQQSQSPDLLAQAQPQPLDNFNPDLTTDDPSSLVLTALSPPPLTPPADSNTQTTTTTTTANPNPNPNVASTSCSAVNANLKSLPSRLMRRAYGEMTPCCEPVNLGLDNPFNWILGQNNVENRSPYCCEGGGFEYARTKLCVPWDKSNPWCSNPDNWACCIYGGPIFNGKVHATHCWSIYPPPVKVPEPAHH